MPFGRSRQRQPETKNALDSRPNSHRVSRGRFRVVGCGAFHLGFDGGLGGEVENTSLFAPVVRQVLAQSQELCRRELDRLTALKQRAQYQAPDDNALGRSRRGFSTKIPLRTNANPLTFDLTGGEVHETQGFDALMKLHDAQPAKLLGDKGYDSDEIRDDLAKRGIEPVIPPRSNRTTPIEYDREAYKRRNLIERCVNHLKQFRRIATRYEKTARAFVSIAMY